VKERIDKIDSKVKEKEGKKYSSYVQLKQTEEKQSPQKPPHRVYGPASIFSTVSSLVFRFHPFMVATRLPNTTT